MLVNESNDSCIERLKNAQLTFRETEVFEQVKQGFTCKEISAKLGIGFETVKTHRKNIITKIGLSVKMEFRKFTLKFLAEEIQLFQTHTHTHTFREKQRLTPKSPLGVMYFKWLTSTFIMRSLLIKF
jgi:DNA-binding CsgD family transcriptional regulator